MITTIPKYQRFNQPTQRAGQADHNAAWSRIAHWEIAQWRVSLWRIAGEVAPGREAGLGRAVSRARCGRLDPDERPEL